jgi:Carboxypeptidase regulatory-like domain
MKTPIAMIVGFSLALVSGIAVPMADAVAGEPCGGMIYRDVNQIDTKIRVRQMRGFAVDKQDIRVPGVCVGLFTDSDHKLIAAVKTSADGAFEFQKVRKGSYRLVVEYEAFGTANSVVTLGWRGATSMVVRMQARGIDTTSYVEGSVPR